MVDNSQIARVIAEHKERYVLRFGDDEFEAEITGNMRFSAVSREDFPAVGDWVEFIRYDNDFAIINKIMPRTSAIKRKAVGQFGEIQIIAANVDYAFIIQAVDRDFNINRLERYLTICYSSRVEPIIVLTKTDLIDSQKLNIICSTIIARLKNVSILAVSNLTNEEIDALKSVIETGKTYCLLGSSGVGKSTLLNNLTGRKVMETSEISSSTEKGRHTTTHRELFMLDNGGFIIDNPGMREVGIADAGEGIENAFESIAIYSRDCKFKDCTHTVEIGCAVLDALNDNLIDSKTYENYLKIEKEISHFEMTSLEKKKKDKQFGKIIKDYSKKDVKGKKN